MKIEYNKNYKGYIFKYTENKGVGKFQIFTDANDKSVLFKEHNLNLKDEKDFEMEIIYQVEKIEKTNTVVNSQYDDYDYDY
jgi:hypothetical protein